MRNKLGQFKKGNTPSIKNRLAVSVASKSRVRVSKAKKNINCKICNKEFSCFNSNIKLGKKYCSRQCAIAGFKIVRKGHVVSQETRKKFSENSQKRFSDKTKHWNWKGGISIIDRVARGMSQYKQWRSDVFTTDNWTCQTCQSKGYVTAHHIKSFSNLLKEFNVQNTDDARKCDELWDINNGVTLCEPCHSLTDNYKGRNKNKKQ